MTLEITQDFLNPEEKRIEVEVPIHAEKPEAGTLLFTIRELPYAVKKSLDMKFIAATVAMEKAADVFGKISRGEFVSDAEFLLIGSSVSGLRQAQLDCVKWGVVGHADSNFQMLGSPVLYESESATLLGTTFQVASTKMLKLYSHISSDKVTDAHKNLLALLSHAVMDFQQGTVKTPQEVYAEYAKP